MYRWLIDRTDTLSNPALSSLMLPALYSFYPAAAVTLVEYNTESDRARQTKGEREKYEEYEREEKLRNEIHMDQ